MKTRYLKTFVACLFLGLPCAAPGKEPSGFQAKDSLQSLKVIISSELEGRSKVLILKDPSVSDSLFRLKTPPDRDRFDRLLSDSSAVEEVETRKEFCAYWRTLEAKYGFTALRDQYTARDIDKGRIPKLYLYDSSVVLYPGWVILRRK